MKDEQYWHIYSDGGKADIPFGTDEDKTYAMNSVAISSFATDATVLAVEINDTHIHAVVRCANGEKARRELQRRLTRHYLFEGRKEDMGEGLYLSVEELPAREDVLSRIIYTFRNCLDFYKKVPWSYRWGVGNLYFAEESNIPHGKPLSAMSFREQYELFQTGLKLPQDWEVDNEGLILPVSYVDYQYVEYLFGTPRAFLAFLYVRKEDEQQMKQRFNARYMENRSLLDLRGKADRLGQSMFGKTLSRLSLHERINVASKMIKAREGAISESFAKALYLKKEDLVRLL